MGPVLLAIVPHFDMTSGMYGVLGRDDLIVYIGQSQHVEKRFADHRRRRRATGFVVLYETDDRAKMNERELWFIKHFRLLSYPIQNKSLAPFSRTAISRKSGMKGKSASLESRQKTSRAMLGHVVSETARRAIGDANRGKILSSETREKVRRARLGTRLSPETIEKIRTAAKRRYTSEV